MLEIMRKTIDVTGSETLYDKSFDEKTLLEDWKIYSGNWYLEDGWLSGKNPANSAGMIVSRNDFTGDILMDFEARTVLPCTHDIDFMWNGSWDEERNVRGMAYVAGLQGWWQGKAGIEKSPDYKLTACTPLFDFTPGKIYHIQGGSIKGHCFLFVNGKLLLEVTDPEPIDNCKYARIGFEAYCSHIQIRNLKVRRIKWKEVEMSYTPEFK